MKFSGISKILGICQRNWGRKFERDFSTLSGYLVLPGVVFLFVFLWVKSQAIDLNQHNRYAINLRRTQELDARINQNVLQARDGLLSYYDPIVNDLAELKTLQTDLKQTPTFIDSVGRDELSSLLQAYIKVCQEKEQRIQKFQSQNAVLRNSLTYFPIAITNLVEKDTTPPTLAIRLNALLRSILLFNLSTDNELVPQIEREIGQILASTTTANSADLKMAIAHARVILNQRSQVNNQVKAIVTLPTTKRSESLAQAYDHSYQHALDTANTYRLWLYLLSFVLIVSVATWIILRLKAAEVKTRQAEEKYRSIFENSVAGIFQTTPDGHYLSANPTLAALYGYESGQELIQTLTDIEHQLYVLLERRAEFIRLMQEKGAVADFESQVYRRDGTVIWVSENARKVCNPSGKVLYYEGTVTDITARKQAEAALQASEAELRLLFAAMTDIVIVFDAQGHYLKYIHTQSLDYKPSVKRVGKTVHEVLPKAIADLFVDGIRQALYLREQSSNLLDYDDRTPLSQGSISVEYCLPIRGRKTWFSASVSALSENTVLWVARDISDRKQAEEALRQSEAKFRNIFENSQVGIFRSRLEDGLILDVNQRWITMMGYDSPAAVIGLKRAVEFYFDPSERTKVVEILRTNGNIHNYETRFRRRDGSIYWVLFSARLNTEEGYFEGVASDISDRKQMEEELRASEQKLSLLFHQTAPALIEWNANFEATAWNPAAETIFGYSASEAIGRHVAELIVPESAREQVNRVVDELLDQQGGTYSINENFTKDGRKIICEWHNTPLVDEGGKLIGVASLALDITQRKQAEAALQQAMSAAEVANRAKSQFLSNMSHELRTPLNVILGFTQLMTRNGSLTPIQQGYLDTISRSGEHLLALINDVLEMSKIEAGRTTLNETSFDLYGLLNWLQAMLRLKADSKGLQLVFDIATDLPQYIRTDESKLRQVLVNLLGNAIKFTQTGSVTLRVSLVTGQWSLVASNQPMTKGKGPMTIHFEVEDTGSGIAATELESLFDPFVQTEAGRNSHEGTGLGLPISQKFVHLMGGEITVGSQLGSGSVFKFDIQTNGVATDELQTTEPLQQVTGLEAGQPNYRILVVEDKQENRRLLVELLAPVGFEVREATNGQEAIALWQSWSPHLIWMDMRMPVMDGFEATKQIKATGSQAPVVIALTGSAFEEDRLTALSIGCDDFVRKPFRAEVIFEKMALHLGARYLYGLPQLQGDSPDNSPQSPQQLILKPEELKQALAQMPVDWVEQLHQAATKVNSKQVHHLIAQMPTANIPLANALIALVNNFCFEEIVKLTQQEASPGQVPF